MVGSERAEAGLSECVRLVPGCSDELGVWLAMWAVGLVLAVVWSSVALYVSLDVLLVPVGVRRTLGWLVAVWLLPLFGVVAWYRYGRRAGPPARPSPRPAISG